MFGMSLAEILIVLVLLLVVVGPERLPDVARVIGKGLREIRRATNMFRDTIQMESDTFDVNTFDPPVDQHVDGGPNQTVDRDPNALVDEGAHATPTDGGYGREIEMRTAAMEAAEAGPDLRRVAIERAETTDATRGIYVPHPHRNILY